MPFSSSVTLSVEAADSSQTSPDIYQTTCHYFLEDSHGHRREKVKPHQTDIYFFDVSYIYAQPLFYALVASLKK
jgi:hypothetical protein